MCLRLSDHFELGFVQTFKHISDMNHFYTYFMGIHAISKRGMYHHKHTKKHTSPVNNAIAMGAAGLSISDLPVICNL